MNTMTENESFNSLEYLKKAANKAFLDELKRQIITDNEKYVIYLEKTVDIYLKYDIFTFFTSSSLHGLTEEICNDKKYRDFILNVVDRANLLTTSSLFSYEDVYDKLGQRYCISRGQAGRISLLNKETIDSININKGILIDILKNNNWLLILFLIILTLSVTDLYGLDISKKA